MFHVIISTTNHVRRVARASVTSQLFFCFDNGGIVCMYGNKVYRANNYFNKHLWQLPPIIIIIIKKDWQCKAGRGRLTPYQSEDPCPTLPIYRGKEEKGKIDKKRESN